MLKTGMLAVRKALVACCVVPLFVAGCSESGDVSGSSTGGQGGGGGTTAAGGDTTTTVASGGDGGGFTGTGGAPECARLEGGEATVPWDGVPGQAYCDGTAQNPADCPASLPEPGAACASPGVTCGYDLGSASPQVSHCQDGVGWSNRAVPCVATCAAPLPEDAVPGSPACGSLPDIPCDDNAGQTDLELASALVRDLASCCGTPTETSVEVTLESGCAVAVHVSAAGGDQGFGACMRSLLAGRRIGCGGAVSCLRAEWSTLP